ncbi:hypothetical protein H257_16429 [Aphanomyces astaci]|uniref:RNase H type-1 domain-containing protein n=1 Tax=Aphanomyces astaci TaxID=112090 RepID=W4FIK0_APHAT|nr:hypothetical protein H257_16429 [Aphanomyces astaci]ETV67347.1 hypothetical protein H257_16429 [Aphanomyces astaci]|eukprot:XP_009843162.1 hypothetical protein H257_16429 [Aphanomyces astaci]
MDAVVVARFDPACGGYDAHFIPTATTNNKAEYDGLLRSLQLAKTRGYTHLTVYGNSQLLVRQMQGIYSVSHPGLRVQCLQARRLAATIHCTWRHRPQEGNQGADFLSRSAR